MKITEDISDIAALTEIGARIESLRLQLNLTQAELAERAGVSKSTIERIERGSTAQLSNFLRVLRPLGLFDQLEILVPPSVASPIAQLKRRRDQRVRASAKPRPAETKTWTWSDDE